MTTFKQIPPRMYRMGVFCSVIIWLLTLPLSPQLNTWAATDDEESSTPSTQVVGTFSPHGPPITPPSRTAAGTHCIIDLVQIYQVQGTLEGTFRIDYRIFVDGPCGSPAGTFNEQWIAWGRFVGTADTLQVSGDFSYLAHVVAGGQVTGEIVFGQGMQGTLVIAGNMNDGYLSYKGQLN